MQAVRAKNTSSIYATVCNEGLSKFITIIRQCLSLKASLLFHNNHPTIT